MFANFCPEISEKWMTVKVKIHFLYQKSQIKFVLYSSLAKRCQNDWQTLQGRTNYEAGFLLLVITAKSAHDHLSMGSNLFSLRGRLKLGLTTVILKQNTENCDQTVCCETTLLGSTNVLLLTSYHNLPDAFKYLSRFQWNLIILWHFCLPPVKLMATFCWNRSLIKCTS